MTASGQAHEVVTVDLTFHAVDGGDDIAHRMPWLFAHGWHAYRTWFLRDGEEPRPSYVAGRKQLKRFMPELVEDYERLVEAVGGGDLEARFLSHWCPPPLFGACSLAGWTSGAKVLVRNYDYPPSLCDGTLLLSGWGGTRVMGMSDCVIGLLDGINEHGLSAAIAFGGRRVVRPGFGVGLIVRYLLQVARDVPEALDVLAQVPCQMAYNVALLDRAGRTVVAQIAPDRPVTLAPRPLAGNRQGQTEWPEHAAFCVTEAREAALSEALNDPHLGSRGLVDRFLREPIYRPGNQTPWGTVYTAVYDSEGLAVDLVWPDDVWRLALHEFHEGARPRRLDVAIPPREHLPPPPVAVGRPLLIA